MFLVLNWKMNPATLADAKDLVALVKREGKKLKKTVTIVAPPAVFLSDLAKRKGAIMFAAQHVHQEVDGSHTGDISVLQVKDVGAQQVIVGHAERRALGESDAVVRAKVLTVLNAGLCPIVCIGEDTRDASGAYLEKVTAQLQSALADVPPSALKKVLIAYEPVWAIGATKPMSTHEMHEMVIFIRKKMLSMHGKPGFSVPILYGGSIDATSAKGMLDGGEVDGLLVGRASSDMTKLKELLRSLSV